jgi:hypothetical protein
MVLEQSNHCKLAKKPRTHGNTDLGWSASLRSELIDFVSN